MLMLFAIYRPVSGFLILLLALFNQNVSETDLNGWNPYIKSVGSIFLLMAMWALFMTWKLTHPVLGTKHATSLKFIAIKLIILVLFLQKVLLGIIEAATGVFDLRPFGAEVNVGMWSNFLLVIEMPALALLLHYAFPVEDSLHGDGKNYLALADRHRAAHRAGEHDGLHARAMEENTANGSSSEPSNGYSNGDSHQ